MKHRVVITGLGIVSPLGEGVTENWKSLLTGKSAVKQIQSFDASTFPTRIGAEVSGFNAVKYIQRRILKLIPQPVQFALAAARLAFADSGIEREHILPERLGVFIGSRGAFSSIEELSPALDVLGDGADESRLPDFWERGVRNINPLWLPRTLANSALCHIAIEYNAQGANCNICNGEVGGCQAIEKAFKAIATGKIDTAIAGGYDSLINWKDINEYSQYRLLTRQNDSPSTSVKPYDPQRDGFAPSEGAAFVILEKMPYALGRDARIYGEILGAFSNSYIHEFPCFYSLADGLAGLMEHSLNEVSLTPCKIDYINPTGLATIREDIEEAKAIRQIFGEAAEHIPVSTAKSAVGNSGVASGLMELIFTLMAIKENTIPPMVNHFHDDPACRMNCIVSPVQAHVHHAMSISMGIGGQNAVIILKNMNFN